MEEAKKSRRERKGRIRRMGKIASPDDSKMLLLVCSVVFFWCGSSSEGVYMGNGLRVVDGARFGIGMACCVVSGWKWYQEKGLHYYKMAVAACLSSF